MLTYEQCHELADYAIIAENIGVPLELASASSRITVELGGLTRVINRLVIQASIADLTLVSEYMKRDKGTR